MPGILDLPNEVLMVLLEYLDPEDILELRATCHRFLDLCDPLFSSYTLYINFCEFPTDVEYLASPLLSLPRRVDLGGRLEFAKHLESLDFFASFNEHVEAVCFHPEEPVHWKHLLKLLEIFSSLKEVVAENRDLINLRNWVLRLSDLQKLQKSLQTVKRFSINYCSNISSLLGIMPSLESFRASCFQDEETFREESGFIRQKAGQLKSLYLEDSHVDDGSQQFFRELRDVKELRLTCLSFSMKGVSEDVALDFLRNQSGLEELEIHHSWFLSNAFVEQIGTLFPRLRVLNLRNGVPKLRGFVFMRNLRTLEELHLVDNRDILSEFTFSNDFHTAFGLDEKFPRLRKLAIKNLVTPICSSCWEKITLAFPNLRDLTLYRVKLDEVSAHSIFRNLQLKSLNVDRCGLTQSMIEGLGSQTNLRSLVIKRNAIEQVPRLPFLRRLDASATRLESIGHLLENCPLLERLNLDDCEGLRSTNVLRVCGTFRKLKTLNLGRCGQTEWRDLIPDPPQPSYLQVLVAEDCDIDRTMLCVIFQEIPSLKFVHCVNLRARRSELEQLQIQ